jgi:hypothetical protein
MAIMSRWLRASVAAAAVTVVLTSTLATCTAGSMTPENEQMACCQGGHHACGPSGEAAACCEKTAPQSQRLILAKPDPFSAPIRVLLLTLTPTQPVVVDAAPTFVVDRAPRDEAITAGPPAYIAFSALLI